MLPKSMERSDAMGFVETNHVIAMNGEHVVYIYGGVEIEPERSPII